MRVLSVDPGSSAALAYVEANVCMETNSTNMRLLAPPEDVVIWCDKRKLVNYWWLLMLLSKYKEYGPPDIITIEKVRSMPNQGIASTAKFMMCTGFVKGFLSAHYCKEVIELSPSIWKPAMGVTADKGTSLNLARKIFGPEHFKLKKHHDRAESCLMAAFISGFRP